MSWLELNAIADFCDVDLALIATTRDGLLEALCRQDSRVSLGTFALVILGHATTSLIYTAAEAIYDYDSHVNVRRYFAHHRFSQGTIKTSPKLPRPRAIPILHQLRVALLIR